MKPGLTPITDDIVSELFPAFRQSPDDIRRRMIDTVFAKLDRTGLRRSLGPDGCSPSLSIVVF
jgi:hypothetical protein